MKTSNRFIVFLLFLSISQGLAAVQPIERSIGKLNISIDPRMELLATVQLLSNYPIVDRSLPYSRDILIFFESFSSHEAVAMTDSLAFVHGFGFDAPVTFMLHLSQPPELRTHTPISERTIRRSGSKDNLEQYRKSIKDFFEISNFETFWNSKISFYNQILDLTTANIEIDFVKTLETYLNETQASYNIILAPAFRGGFGPQIPNTDGKYNIYAVLSVPLMKEGIPYLSKESLLHYVWHEFGHSFVNPLAVKYADRVYALSSLFEPIKDVMARQAYRRWETVLNEHIIRAINVRLMYLHFGFEKSNAVLADELERGFIYIEPLIEKLKIFENEREESDITFSQFYPKLLSVLDNIQKTEN